MKLVKEHINEKFDEDSDPIEDLGIGIYTNRDFTSSYKMSEWILKNLHVILKTDSIPDDIIFYDNTMIKRTYYRIINEFVKQYFTINNVKPYNFDPEKLRNMLKAKGYKKTAAYDES